VAEKDLSTLLRTLTVSQRPGRYCFVDLTDVKPGVTPAATVQEDGETTAVVLVQEVAGEQPEFIAAWLTLRVNSDLAAVGLTATVASCLALEGIACNILAGKLHDHVLVPENEARRAIDAIEALAR
jgi:uncharacterized protein